MFINTILLASNILYFSMSTKGPHAFTHIFFHLTNLYLNNISFPDEKEKRCNNVFLVELIFKTIQELFLPPV